MLFIRTANVGDAKMGVALNSKAHLSRAQTAENPQWLDSGAL